MSRSLGLSFKVCYVCGDKITKYNTAGFLSNGKLQPVCRVCHAEVAYCKLWRKKPVKVIRANISILERRIMVLNKIIQRKLTGFPKTVVWRAKRK